ncbi:hypothetical protein [Sinobacterium caligoides]|nr:hypothetical protein [Sinobacterium caligoides]
MDPRNNCGCSWQGPFSWIADNVDTIAVVSIASHSGNSMDVNVEQLLKGKTYDKVVRIWGDRGYECRPPVELFPRNSRWLLALQTIDKLPADSFDPFHPDRSFGRIGDYQLPACGAYWLAVEGDRVSGNITSILDWDYTPEMDPVPIAVIKAFIEGKAGYADIIGYSNEITSPEAMMRKSKLWLKNQQD